MSTQRSAVTWSSLAAAHPRYVGWLPGTRGKFKQRLKKAGFGKGRNSFVQGSFGMPLLVRFNIDADRDLPLCAVGEYAPLFRTILKRWPMSFQEVGATVCDPTALMEADRILYGDSVTAAIERKPLAQTPDEQEEVRLAEQSAAWNNAFWQGAISRGHMLPQIFVGLALDSGLQLCSFEQALWLAYYSAWHTLGVGESFFVWCVDPKKKMLPEWDMTRKFSQIVRVVVTHDGGSIRIEADDFGLVEMVQLDTPSYFGDAI